MIDFFEALARKSGGSLARRTNQNPGSGGTQGAKLAITVWLTRPRPGIDRFVGLASRDRSASSFLVSCESF